VAPDDWKAWLELALLVAVTLLALGRWVFGREHIDENHATKISTLDGEHKRLRERVHGLASDQSRSGIQLAVQENRLDSIEQRLDSLEDKRHRPNNRRPNQT